MDKRQFTGEARAVGETVMHVTIRGRVSSAWVMEEYMVVPVRELAFAGVVAHTLRYSRGTAIAHADLKDASPCAASQLSHLHDRFQWYVAAVEDQRQADTKDVYISQQSNVRMISIQEMHQPSWHSDGTMLL